MIDKENIIPLLKILIKDLEENNYDLIEKTNRIAEGTAKDIEYGIKRYKNAFKRGEVTYPPEDDFQNFDKYDYDNNPNGCLIEYDLWIDNEKSDLTLRAEVVKDDVGKYQIRIQDILVM